VVSAVASSAASASGDAGTASQGSPATYVNPVSQRIGDTFADPSVIRGKDGFWYAYGTSDPLREGERTEHRVPVARSTDLVDWRYVGDAFTAAKMPTWAAPDAHLWAPDIRYVDGQYRMYYVVTQTTVTDERDDNAIGMATAPSPTGPWTDSGAPVVGPRRGGAGEPGNFLWTFDPSAVTDTDGTQWLFYGSYYGGLFVTKLDTAGRHALGTPTQVAIDNKFEGAYVVRREGFWYLFASTANCCAGPTTGYSVQVGRSTDLRGPYVDQQGTSLMVSRAGGTPVLNQNGNAWIGAGHNAIVTDLAGRDWIAYHAIDRADPYLDEPFGINERPMLLDRLDWVDGWPAVRAGRGPSDQAQRAPATSGRWVTSFDAPPAVDGTWQVRGGWRWVNDTQSGRHVLSTGPGRVLTGASAGRDVRVEADLQSKGAAYGLVSGRDEEGVTRLVVDPARRTATLTQTVAGAVVRGATSTLPRSFTPANWHSVVLQTRGRVVHATVSNARLGDPVVDLRLIAASRTASAGNGAQGDGRAGALAVGSGVGVDNLSVLPTAQGPTELAAEPVPSRLDRSASDEFSLEGAPPEATWRWVRPDPDALVADGALRWPTQAGDLVGDRNDASLLLREPGEGSWAVQTKVSIDLGTDSIRNFQQAGLVAYVGDDLFTRLSHVAIWNTRQTEFGKEMPFAGQTSFGGTVVGPPAATTWLRLTHRVDPRTGEHLLRAWSSRDGTTWVMGGVWTLPAGADVKVGLVSHGGVGATARFDYFRLYRP